MTEVLGAGVSLELAASFDWLGWVGSVGWVGWVGFVGVVGDVEAGVSALKSSLSLGLTSLATGLPSLSVAYSGTPF